MKKPFLFIILFIWATQLFAGDLPDDSHLPSNNLTVSGGFGTLYVKDQSISGLKYSGSISNFTLAWSDYNAENGLHLGLNIKEGTEIANRNISAEILILALDLDFLRIRKGIKFLKKDSYLFVGPSTGTDLYFRLQNIAFEGGSSDEALSVLLTIPLGVKANLFYPISPSFHIEIGGYLNVFSVGLRYPSNKEDELDLKLLHPVNGFNGILDVAAMYRLQSKINLSITLNQQLSNTTAWDESVLFANTNFLIGLLYAL